MKIHEYQAKAILSQFGVPIPKGEVAASAVEVRDVATQLGGKVAIKAQIHAGGRGKAGGIRVADSPQEAEEIAQDMIGSSLITHQTTAEGVPVQQVLVEEAIEVKRELYLGIIVDRAANRPAIMVSEAGGMDIEEVAAKSPEKILIIHIDPAVGYQPFIGRLLAFGMNLAPEEMRPTVDLIANLYKVFLAKDCSLAEINPLVITSDGRIIALDAKLNFDDNALYRHEDLAELRDTAQEDPLEVMAANSGINNYIKLSGNIGCVVNGAGLAMATMDIIKLAGGEPANFLDIGTVNNVERVINAFKILTSDPQVKAILINIFGGMARVDIIAAGIVESFKLMDVLVPVVVRLAGTNAEEGQRILDESGVKVIRATDFHDAAVKAVAASQAKI